MPVPQFYFNCGYIRKMIFSVERVCRRGVLSDPGHSVHLDNVLHISGRDRLLPTGLCQTYAGVYPSGDRRLGDSVHMCRYWSFSTNRWEHGNLQLYGLHCRHFFLSDGQTDDLPDKKSKGGQSLRKNFTLENKRKIFACFTLKTKKWLLPTKRGCFELNCGGLLICIILGLCIRCSIWLLAVSHTGFFEDFVSWCKLSPVSENPEYFIMGDWGMPKVGLYWKSFLK